MSFLNDLGPAQDNKGAIPDDLNSIDPIEIELRARTAAIALNELVPFLDQIHASTSDKLETIYGRDWNLDASNLCYIAQSLNELADEAERLDADNASGTPGFTVSKSG